MTSHHHPEYPLQFIYSYCDATRQISGDLCRYYENKWSSKWRRKLMTHKHTEFMTQKCCKISILRKLNLSANKWKGQWTTNSCSLFWCIAKFICSHFRRYFSYEEKPLPIGKEILLYLSWDNEFELNSRWTIPGKKKFA